MSQAPFFSIITITYNNLSGLRHTAQSLASQSYSDYEWIVVDGASDDGSLDWLRNSKANWISEKDDGIYHAMNKGIRRSYGQYLLFLNAGDILASKNVLNNIAREIKSEATPPDFVYGDSLEKNKDGKSLYKRARSHKNIRSGMFTHHQAMMYRSEALKKLRFSQLYDIAADYDFTARFLLQSKHILYWPHPVCVFEQGGVSQKKVLLGRAEQFHIRRNLGVNDTTNASIFIAQTIAWNFRKIFPSLYWSIKSAKKSSGSKSVG